MIEGCWSSIQQVEGSQARQHSQTPGGVICLLQIKKTPNTDLPSRKAREISCSWKRGEEKGTSRMVDKLLSDDVGYSSWSSMGVATFDKGYRRVSIIPSRDLPNSGPRRKRRNILP